jgi:NADH dehydrogenase FAD-containing subunit
MLHTIWSCRLGMVHGCSKYIRYITSLGKVQGRIVIIGSGWAGFKLLETLDQNNYDIVVISPRNYFLFTPLLASTCVGTLEFRAIMEPIRRQQRKGSVIKYYEAFVAGINIHKKTISCQSVFETPLHKDQLVGEVGESIKNIGRFELSYDHAVIACGAVTNTFNIPGVLEHAWFLKDINDARRIRYRILECFERASQLGISEEEQKHWLNFVIVGGGPTGIEFSAELHDFITEDLMKIYPNLADKIQMTLIDVAPKILSTFDLSLSDYTTKKFARKGIQIRTGTKVTEVKTCAINSNQDIGNITLILQDGSRVICGLLVWATGLSPNPLLQSLPSDIPKCTRSGRLITDGYFRVLSSNEKYPSEARYQLNPSLGLYAIGDCSTVLDNDLPCTAQVAKQKAKYLGKLLNDHVNLVPIDSHKPFSYKDAGSMAYIGQWRAIAGLSLNKEKKWNESGILAWLLWRSAYFTMSVSWRNKVLIPTYWLLTWIMGRDISHIK